MDPEEEKLAVINEVAATFLDKAVGGTNGGGYFEVASRVGEAVLCTVRYEFQIMGEDIVLLRSCCELAKSGGRDRAVVLPAPYSSATALNAPSYRSQRSRLTRISLLKLYHAHWTYL